MISGIIILIVMILMVAFISKRVKKGRQLFDDIEVRDKEDNK